MASNVLLLGVNVWECLCVCDRGRGCSVGLCCVSIYMCWCCVLLPVTPDDSWRSCDHREIYVYLQLGTVFTEYNTMRDVPDLARDQVIVNYIIYIQYIGVFTISQSLEQLPELLLLVLLLPMAMVVGRLRSPAGGSSHRCLAPDSATEAAG